MDNVRENINAGAENFCKHIVSVLITFPAKQGYYRYEPAKYVQKCTLCWQLSDYCNNPEAAYASLMKKPAKY